MATNANGYMRNYFKKWKNRIIQQLGGKCVSCFDTVNLEIHHIKPLCTNSGRGRTERLTDWKKQLSTGNIILLCQNCHRWI